MTADAGANESDDSKNLSLKSWREDERVHEALKHRECSDVCLVDCPWCGSQNYYNEGSHAWCHVCDRHWDMLADDESPPEMGDYQYIYDSTIYTVEDAIDAEVQAEIDGIP